MNNQIKARAGLALAVLTCTAVVGASLTGAARYDEGSIDAASAVAAVQGVAPNAVSNVAASTPTGDDAVVSKTTATTVSIPVDAKDGIHLQPDGPGASMTIGLPNGDASDPAAVSSETGVVVYDNNDGSSTVPVIHNDGTQQITTVLKDAKAPRSFA